MNFLLVVLAFSAVDSADAAPSADQSRRNRVCLLVEHADISPSRKVKPAMRYLALANYGHEVQVGKNLVFVLREFKDGGEGVDSAHFEKLTLRLAHDMENNDVALGKPVGVTTGYYTEGGVGFINRGAYWRANSTNPIRQINFVRTTSGIDAEINATFETTYESDKSKKEVKIEVRCPVRRSSVSLLNPWEGKPGFDWNSFAPASGEGFSP
jgi:hypothetical protein